MILSQPPIIDPVTGLPLFGNEQYIQQIPLGIQPFAYEDMQATARPTRPALYGDDVIPTASIIQAPDPSGKMRTGSMDTEQNLWVRNMEYNSFDGTIDDGDSGPIDINLYNATSNGVPFSRGAHGPIDVNLAGNSVGVAGAGPYIIDATEQGVTDAQNIKTFSFVSNTGPFFSTKIGNVRYLTGVMISWCITKYTVLPVDVDEWLIYATDTNDTHTIVNQISIWDKALLARPITDLPQSANGDTTIMFNPPIDLYATLGVSDGFYWEYGMGNLLDGYITHTWYGYH